MPTPGFRPSHVVPPDGMPAWEAPDPARPTVSLDPLLPVQLTERRGDWGHVLCANGWSAWVDGRLLVTVPQDPPTADGPLEATADPLALLTGAETVLARYRAAAQELAAGGLDGAAFRQRTEGLRIGVVVDGADMWLYDAERDRWLYGDGTRLSTYAAEGEPRPPGQGARHAPTRAVASDGDA
ncbi:hypothetical protein [Streptomyces sp. MUM 2J]|uniref:hypothetical protein n=1 Tax=Streptomyces sp. MUM 2J TaxID=2791987 RepID=UPI001F0448EF|nr:hypothetical protein [Streptomyces sp. MUM 2J]MCH0566612.1 hypothetical protein [Streptomyces sp. MUM 2J]